MVKVGGMTAADRQLAFINELFKGELCYAKNGGYREYMCAGYADILDMTERQMLSIFKRLESHRVGQIVRQVGDDRHRFFQPSKAFEEFCQGMVMMAGNNPPFTHLDDLEVFINCNFYCAKHTIDHIGIQGQVLKHATNLHGIKTYEFVPTDQDRALYELHTR